MLLLRLVLTNMNAAEHQQWPPDKASGHAESIRCDGATFRSLPNPPPNPLVVPAACQVASYRESGACRRQDGDLPRFVPRRMHAIDIPR